MTIPNHVLDIVRQATADLVDSKVEWASAIIAGVGAIFDDSQWKVSILLLKPGTPPQLQDFISHLPIAAVTTVTGSFGFLLGAGDEIDSHCAGFGTLTAIVKDAGDNRFLLSCNHVLGGIECQIDDDTGRPIANATKLISFDNEPIPADAGIASLLVSVSTGFPQFPELSSNQPVKLETGDHVRHIGAVSSGASTIAEVEVTLRINVNGVFRRFSKVALVDANFAKKGDSGSVVINTDTQRPTGIVFAKGQFDRRPTRVAICSLGAALATLGVSIL